MSKKIKLESLEGQEFEVEKDAICMSETIRNMLTDISASTVDSLPLSNIKGETLKKIIEYCEYHHAHPSPVAPDKEDFSTDNIEPWDQALMEVPMGLLFDIVLAANYLDIKGLLDLGCKIIANMIKGKTPDEVKKTFRIPDEELQKLQQAKAP